MQLRRAAFAKCQMPCVPNQAEFAKLSSQLPTAAPAGFVYCNMPPLQFQLEERVRMYVMALGNEVDVHSPNSHIAMHASGRQHTLPALTMVPGARRPEGPHKVQGNCSVRSML